VRTEIPLLVAGSCCRSTARGRFQLAAPFRVPPHNLFSVGSAPLLNDRGWRAKPAWRWLKPQCADLWSERLSVHPGSHNTTPPPPFALAQSTWRSPGVAPGSGGRPVASEQAGHEHTVTGQSRSAAQGTFLLARRLTCGRCRSPRGADAGRLKREAEAGRPSMDTSQVEHDGVEVDADLGDGRLLGSGAGTVRSRDRLAERLGMTLR
jgi:hypothetical protein